MLGLVIPVDINIQKMRKQIDRYENMNPHTNGGFDVCLPLHNAKKMVDRYEKLLEKEQLKDKVILWAKERDLHLVDPRLQMLKMTEEVGELANALGKGKQELIADGIGDVLVVLRVLCLQLDLNLEECLRVAYEEIKDRKGVMVNGFYVKLGDLDV